MTKNVGAITHPSYGTRNGALAMTSDRLDSYPTCMVKLDRTADGARPPNLVQRLKRAFKTRPTACTLVHSRTKRNHLAYLYGRQSRI